MGLVYYEIREENVEVGGRIEIKEKYTLDSRGQYCRSSFSARLVLEPVTLSPKDQERVISEAEEYELSLFDCEYGDHDDLGKMDFISSSKQIPLDSPSIKGILLRDGHFFGFYVQDTAITIAKEKYGECSYSLTPEREDTERIQYMRYCEYELKKKS